MMKIVFLGAGASHAAGYPLTSALLPELEKMTASTPNIFVPDYWKRFSVFRNKTTGVIKRIMFSTNPEVILSLIDLYTECYKNEEQEGWKEFERLLKQLKSEAVNSEEIPDDSYDTEEKGFNKDKKVFFDAKLAIHAFLKCVDHFFFLQHCCDFEKGTKRWQYLKSELSLLSKGDIVITTNWDTLAERVLSDNNRWTPRDGYGFQVQLKYVDSNGRPLSFTSDVTRTIPESSDVKVLKLHGSYGWRQKKGSSELYLKSASYLQYLPIKNSKQDIYVIDSGAPSYDQYDVNPVMIYPSFFKQLKWPQLQSIWYQASKAMNEADEVHVIGYSLPESDTALRTLLNTIKFRLEENTIKRVTIDDPDSETRERWKNFLGEKITLRNRRLGN